MTRNADAPTHSDSGAPPDRIEVTMEASTSWMPSGFHPQCPACAHRGAAALSRPSVQRLSDGSEVEADVLRGPSLIAANLELDELPRAGADIIGIRIPSLSSDDVIQLRIPRACVDGPTLSVAGDDRERPHRPANSLVLPQRWYLLEASLPTVVSRTSSGCTRIEFDAPADPGASEVVLTIIRHMGADPGLGIGA